MSKILQVVLKIHQYSSPVGDSDESESYHVAVLSSPIRTIGGGLKMDGLRMDNLDLVPAYHELVNDYLEGNNFLSEVDLQPLRLIGNQLFHALPQSVQNILRQTYIISQQKQQKVQFVFLFTQSAEPLLMLPWELLHDPDNRRFFALHSEGIIRRLDIPPTANQPTDVLPKKILGVWAETAQNGNSPLTDRSETIQISPKTTLLQFEWIEGADTVGQLQKALNTGQFDGLHIVAHGPNMENEQSRGSFLFLVNEAGETRRFSPNDLAILISSLHSMVRFVYLEVCSSGQADGTDISDRRIIESSGFAKALLGTGKITAVIVMQQAIQQTASGCMAQAFYKGLATGETISEAMVNGRRAAWLQQSDPINWSMPAVYIQDYIQQRQELSLPFWLTQISPYHLFGLVFTLIVFNLVAFLSHQLAQIDLSTVAGWQWASLRVMACTSLTLLMAAFTTGGQIEMGQRYRLQKFKWMKVLLHKYTDAAVSALFGGWMPTWLIWSFLYVGGFITNLTPITKQFIWIFCLMLITVSSYRGAQQGLDTANSFLRIKAQVLNSNIISWLALITFWVIGPLVIPGFSIFLIIMWWNLTEITGWEVPILMGALVLFGILFYIGAEQSKSR